MTTTLTVDDRELIEEVATTIDPVWMIPPQGPHPLDNYPGQADKYREKARQAARAVLQMPRLQSLLSDRDKLREVLRELIVSPSPDAFRNARAALTQTEVP